MPKGRQVEQPRVSTGGPQGLTGGDGGQDVEFSAEQQSADPLAAILESLDSKARVSVERTSPSWAKGWLGDLEVPAGDEGELLDVLKGSYGGGTYTLRLKKQRPDGRRVFVHGVANITIAGQPMIDGVVMTAAGPATQQAQAAPVVQYLPPTAQNSDVMNALINLLTQRQNQPNGAPLQGVPELVSALNSAAHPPAPDPLAGLERTIGLLSKARSLFGDGNHQNDDGIAVPGMSGFDDTKLLAMLLGNQQQQQHHPQQPFGYAPQPQPQAAPQGHYHWNGQAYDWRLGPPPPPAPPPPPNGQPMPNPQPPPAPPPQAQQDDDDDEPYTPDDVLAGVRELTDAQKLEVIARLGEVLPENIASAMQSQLGNVVNLGK